MKLTFVICSLLLARFFESVLVAADAVPPERVWDLSRLMAWAPQILEETDVAPVMRENGNHLVAVSLISR